MALYHPMLDAFIIEELKRRKREQEERERPQPTKDLPEEPVKQPEKKKSPDDPDRGVVIIEYGAQFVVDGYKPFYSHLWRNLY